MVTTTPQQKDRIATLLSESTSPRLADCVDMIPDEHLQAITAMIAADQANNVPNHRIRFHVVQDVAAILEGKPQLAEYSKPFLTPKAVAA